MEVPPETNPIWSKLVTGDLEYQFSFLAAKILLTRVKLKAKFSNEPNVTEEGITQLRNLFIRLQHIPNIQRDLVNLFTGDV